VFFATLELHRDMARQARLVAFGPTTIPILAPEHLIVCKTVFDRPKDWVDIDAMLAWGTQIDADETLRWVAEILGPDADGYRRLADRLVGADGSTHC
jgi:hypothetical protein